jgi:hypothetical protein
MGTFALLALLTAASSSTQAVVLPPVPFFPQGPPAGWERESFSPYLAGNLASYKLSRAPGAEQYLSAKAYWGFSDLGKFVVTIDANLQNAKRVNPLREEPTTVCGSEPASEIEFSEAGLVPADPNRILNVEQVRTVKNGWAYVSTYIRPSESPKRPDAEQWIRAFCQSPD